MVPSSFLIAAKFGIDFLMTSLSLLKIFKTRNDESLNLITVSGLIKQLSISKLSD
ncbi:hypothetical protein VCRA2120O332_20731 [Vibrio crassostreae]|nr:hypothetical protein VCRA2114E327_70192 [Vibrio crassostreae]CAK3533064.1 hypothetical protein VCRA2120O332_20731 [Vibrio crassostreae]